MTSNESKSKSGSTLPPPVPLYTLLGHSSAVQDLHFLHSNLHLISGDADGFVIVWSIVTKRPVAVWKAHEGCILGVGSWEGRVGECIRVVSHGKDSHLRVWELPLLPTTITPIDNFSTVPPTSSSAPKHYPEPWLLYSLRVNTLNFCSFSSCPLPYPTYLDDSSTESEDARFLAIPNSDTSTSELGRGGNGDSSAIDVILLPSLRKVGTIYEPGDAQPKTGMAMCVSIFTRNCTVSSNEHVCVYVAIGYESGHVAIFAASKSNSSTLDFQIFYLSQAHTQPVLSVYPTPLSTCDGFILSSSADSLLIKHPLPTPPPDVPLSRSSAKLHNTHHASQQCLRIRSDGRIFGTAGWDGRARIYSSKTMREIAVLKAPGTQKKDGSVIGCRCIEFGDIFADERGKGSEKTERVAEEQSLVERERNEMIKRRHWVGLGAKDGKITLWDVC